MAVIKIFFEGGVLVHQNVNIQTLNNSQNLRESFYKLLTQKLNPNEFSLQVEIGGPKNQALNFFKSSISKNSNVFLLIDLDSPKHKRNETILSFQLEQESHKENIFFMVQEMEAWILSQPDKIENCYKTLKRKLPKVQLSEDNTIKGIDPESIVKPSEKLAILLGRYFSYEKKGVWKNKKYNKLKDGADLLELLDFTELMSTFSDVKSLYFSLKKKN